ncbi:MAG: DUF4340 domain-containing protein [Deltaproteobacteria bacterium]|nr:MAG: DUF4340 domain-containing protein [Deltaproteobacteria bacterium]
MRIKTTIILAVVLLLLGTYLYFVEIPEEKNSEEAAKVFDLDEDRITQLRMKLGDEVTVCSKNNEGEWEITKPLKAEANQALVKVVLDNLQNLEIKRVVEDSPITLSPYGLDYPNAETTVVLDGVPEGLTLQIGWKSEIGDSLYVKRKDEDRVLLVSYEMGKKTVINASDLREKRVVIFDMGRLQKMELSYPDRNILLAKQQRDWQILEPVKARADDFEVSQLIYAITAMKIERFIDEPSDLGQYGLTHPGVRVTLEVEEEEAKPVILLGKQEKDSELAYAKREGKHPVYLVKSYIVNDLTRETNQLRDKKLFKFDKTDVTKIEIKHGKDTITLNRDPQREWRIAEAGNVKAIKGEIDELLSALEELEVTSFVDDNPQDLEAYGLDRPIFQESFWLGNDNKETILVGKEDKSKKEQFVKKESEPSVYLAKKGLLVRLMRKMNELREPEE